MARLPRHTLRVIVVGLISGSALVLIASSSGVSRSPTATTPVATSNIRELHYEDIVRPAKTAYPFADIYTGPKASPEPTVKPAAKAKPKPSPKTQPKSAPRSVSTNYRPGRTFSSSVMSARAYAKTRIGARQFYCLDVLWTKESGWRTKAGNSSSGAYGIPQALPASKMASAGDDWRTNPTTQVRWGLRYISGRYGSACSALQHFYRYNWY